MSHTVEVLVDTAHNAYMRHMLQDAQVAGSVHHYERFNKTAHYSEYRVTCADRATADQVCVVSVVPYK